MNWPWPKGFPRIYSSLTVDALSAHQDFRAAKHGDREAAARLVEDLADRPLMREVGRRFCGAGLITVANSEENTNQIPNAFAALFAHESQLELHCGVVKINRPAHTGRGAGYRFAHRAEFDGKIPAGRSYVLLDDVATQGGTISELRQWVYRQQARVCAVATLVYTPSRQMSDGRTIAPTPATLGRLDERFGLEQVSSMLTQLGIYEGSPYCLTESEALLIAQSPTLKHFVGKIEQEFASQGPVAPGAELLTHTGPRPRELACATARR